MSGNCRRSRDPYKDYGQSTDFSWGPGLRPSTSIVARRARVASRGTCPPVEQTEDPDLSVRTVQVGRSHGRRPDGSPNGYPGERVG